VVLSVKDLDACAAEHLEHYTNPAGYRAFRTYDVLSDPYRLAPVDFFAPALLDAALPGAHVIKMHQSRERVPGPSRGDGEGGASPRGGDRPF
jgi:hypothetical protein